MEHPTPSANCSLNRVLCKLSTAPASEIPSMTADDTLFGTTTQLTYIIGIIGILYSTWKLMAAPGHGSGGLVLQPADQTSQAPPENPPEKPLHEPGVADVLVVKAMLIKALSLPPEIVDYLIDLAEYWPHTTAGISFESPTTVARGDSHMAIRGHNPMENAFLVKLTLLLLISRSKR